MFWLPVIGPIIQGLMTTGSSIYMKYKDTELGKLQTNRTNDVEEAKVAAQIIRDTNDDIALRILRDTALVMPVGWGALIGWDTIVAKRFPDMMFHVVNYPDAVGYLPYMAYAFLFGVLGLNIWKRK